MKTTIILWLAIIVFAGQACYEDKGNYTYIPTKAVTFSLNPASRTAYVGEEYIYYPKVIFSDLQDTTGYEFWWEHKGINSGPDRCDTICLGRELHFIPKETGYTNIRICAREVGTGAIYSGDMQLNAMSSYAKGWIILSEHEGNSSVSYIRPEYEINDNEEKVRKFTAFPHLYQQFSPDDPLGNGPAKIRQVLGSSNTKLLVIQQSGSVYLNGESYVKELDFRQEFVGGDYPAGLHIKDFFYGYAMDVLLDENGEIYTRDYGRSYGTSKPFYSYRFSNIPAEYQGQKLLINNIITARPNGSGYYGLHDAVNKRIVWVSIFTYGEYIPSKFTVEPGTEYIDFNHFGEWNLIFAGVTGEGGMKGNITALFQKGDEAMIQQQVGSIPWPNPQSVDMTNVELKSFTGKNYTTENTRYFMLSTRPYFFFSEKNTVYWYDLNGEKAHPFYTFPNGSVIIGMDSNPQESELGVALENGTFVVLNIQNEMMYAGEKVYELPGLGKITDIKYKYTNYNEYSGRDIINYWD